MMKRLMAMGAAVLLAGAAWGAEFQQINSRVFDAVRYDGQTRTLTLVFNDGAAYAYDGVPREVYLDFTRIVNKGEYFGKHIRNRFPCERIDRYPNTWAARD